jgi:hypothetical protein
MSVLNDIVRGATAEVHSGPVGSREWLDAQTPEDRAYFIRHGCAPLPPRPRIVKLDGPSVLDGRRGVSMEALELFELAKKGGGQVDLLSLRRWARVNDLQRLVDELAHFGVVVSDGNVVSIVADSRNVILTGPRWRRWS